MVPRSSKRQASFCGCSLWHAGVRRKIRRAAGDEIEFFLGAQNFRRAKIAFADFVAVVQCRCSARIFWRARRFRFAPRRSQISRRAVATRKSCPTVPMPLPRSSAVRAVGHQRRAIPRGQNVVGGKTVAVAQLKQAEMPADGVERFVRFNRHAGGKSGRNGSGFGPAFEMRFVGHHAAEGCNNPARLGKGKCRRSILQTQFSCHERVAD